MKSKNTINNKLPENDRTGPSQVPGREPEDPGPVVIDPDLEPLPA